MKHDSAIPCLIAFIFHVMPDEEQYNAFTNLDPHNFQDISLKADGRYKFKMHVTFQIFWHFIKRIIAGNFASKIPVVMVHTVVKEAPARQWSRK